MRNDADLSDVFIGLYEKLSTHPKFIDFLADSAAFYDDAVRDEFFDSTIGAILRDHIVSQLDLCETMAREVCDFFSSGAFADGIYLPPFAADLQFCAEAKTLAEGGSYTSVGEFLASYSPMRRKNIKAEDKSPECDYHISLRDTVKNKITDLSNTYFPFSFTDEEMRGLAEVSAKRIRILHSLLKEFDKALSDEKLHRGICDFTDVKLRAYKLLVAPDGSPTDIQYPFLLRTGYCRFLTTSTKTCSTYWHIPMSDKFLSTLSSDFQSTNHLPSTFQVCSYKQPMESAFRGKHFL